MASRREHRSLFEVISRSRQSRRRGVSVPNWMRHADAMESSVESAEPTVPPELSRDARRNGWFWRPVRIRLPMWAVLLFGASVVFLVFVAAWVGMEYQARRTRSFNTEYSEKLRPVEGWQKAAPNPALIPSSVAKVSAPEAGFAAPPASAGAAGADADPREPGLNYFRLVMLPKEGLDEGQRAVEYLRGNGIDAMLIPINNNRFKLLAGQGFRRVGSTEARAYKNRLLSLGRLWKSRHRGTSNWSDLYPEKFIPGRR